MTLGNFQNVSFLITILIFPRLIVITFVPRTRLWDSIPNFKAKTFSSLFKKSMLILCFFSFAYVGIIIVQMRSNNTDCTYHLNYHRSLYMIRIIYLNFIQLILSLSWLLLFICLNNSAILTSPYRHTRFFHHYIIRHC